MTYYQILNLQPTATAQQIKEAYRDLVKEFHPDKNPSEEAKQIILSINEAYEVLSDPSKKIQYDQRLAGVYVGYEEEIDEREAYRQAYIRKKNLEARNACEKKERFKKSVFSFLKVIHICLFILAVMLIVDYLIPGKEYEQYAIQGWQRQTRSKYGLHLHSYIQTPKFTLQVPHELHLNYNYYGDKQLLTISASRILDTPLTVLVHEDKYTILYKVFGTVYQLGIWPALLLLLNAGYVIRSKYNFWSYMACFSPMFTILAMII